MEVRWDTCYCNALSRRSHTHSIFRLAHDRIAQQIELFSTRFTHQFDAFTTRVTERIDTLINLVQQRQEPSGSCEGADLFTRRENVLKRAFKRAYSGEEDMADDEADHDVQFWTIEQFKAAGGVLGAAGHSQRLGFLEDSKGIPIDKKRASNIRAHLHRAFHLLASVEPAAVIKSWGKADEALLDVVYCDLRLNFPEFRYCENNWKAQQFMTEWYPNFYRPFREGVAVASGVIVKTEQDDSQTGGTSLKRAGDGLIKPPKKVKGVKGKAREVDTAVPFVNPLYRSSFL
jgi:hypothetical protein